MDTHLEFANTWHDVIDAYEAQRIAGGGLRPWARGLLAVIGLLWVVGFGVMIGEAEFSWQPFASLAAGLFALRTSALQPLLLRRRIKLAHAETQQVSLSLSDRGITVLAQGQDEFTRPWEELNGLLPAKKGLLMRFSGGAAHWVPQRAFKDRQAKDRFVASVHQRLSSRSGDTHFRNGARGES